MQNCLHEYWHFVGRPNLFCKLTNKLKALMDSTINLLRVQVAPMLLLYFGTALARNLTISHFLTLKVLNLFVSLQNRLGNQQCANTDEDNFASGKCPLPKTLQKVASMVRLFAKTDVQYEIQ